MIKIEFFHDVICSFCFPLSYRMRLLNKQYPEIEIIHRSFALVRDPQDFAKMFGSREKAKQEILHHWQHANENDDLHRFNINGMKKAKFDFPISMPALIACKAAYLTAGNNAYWDAFDALQQALFVSNLDIEDEQIIKQCIETLSFDFFDWQQHYTHPATLHLVESDLMLAKQYAINSVPCLVINGRTKISGAQSLASIEKIINQFDESTQLSTKHGSCQIDKGKIKCD